MMTSMPDVKILYRAFVAKDNTYEGLFYAGIKSTNIFCRMTCRAKKPKLQNVEFFSSTAAALEAGYRPCKLCRPLDFPGNPPGWVKIILDEIVASPDVVLKDEDIRKRGVDPQRLRRWFIHHYGITFRAYCRSLCVTQAFERIKSGDKVIEAAYASGYESLSGFTDSFKKKMGFPPNQSMDKQVIILSRMLTPLGPMLAGTLEEGICLLEFMDHERLEKHLTKLKKKFRCACVIGSHHHLSTLEEQLFEYFAGKRKDFQVPLVLCGSEFQKRAWQVLREIPYGATCSYQQQAEKVGTPKAIRAVAQANRANAIAIVIPCHRVIGKDGQLVGYGGGLWRKKYLLEHERKYL